MRRKAVQNGCVKKKEKVASVNSANHVSVERWQRSSVKTPGFPICVLNLKEIAIDGTLRKKRV